MTEKRDFATYGISDFFNALSHAQDTLIAMSQGKPVRDLDEQLSWIKLLLAQPMSSAVSELAAQEWVPFNINEYVRVKLNEKGLAILKADGEELRQRFPKLHAWEPPKTDAEGWSKHQMWSLMENFGPHIRLGGNAPFETTIEFKAPVALSPLAAPYSFTDARIKYIEGFGKVSPMREELAAFADGWNAALLSHIAPNQSLLSRTESAAEVAHRQERSTRGQTINAGPQEGNAASTDARNHSGDSVTAPASISAGSTVMAQHGATEASSGSLTSGLPAESRSSIEPLKGDALYASHGYALAVRVLQSDLYAKLDSRERAECDALVRGIAVSARLPQEK